MNYENRIYDKISLFSNLKNNIDDDKFNTNINAITLEDILYLPFVYSNDETYKQQRDTFIHLFYRNHVDTEIKYCKNNIYYCLLITLLELCKNKRKIYNKEDKKYFDIKLTEPKYTDIKELFKAKINNDNIYFDFQLIPTQRTNEFDLDNIVNIDISDFLNKNMKYINTTMQTYHLNLLLIHFSTVYYILHFYNYKIVNVFEILKQNDNDLSIGFCQKPLNFMVNNAFQKLKRIPSDNLENMNKKRKEDDLIMLIEDS